MEHAWTLAESQHWFYEMGTLLILMIMACIIGDCIRGFFHLVHRLYKFFRIVRFEFRSMKSRKKLIGKYYPFYCFNPDKYQAMINKEMKSGWRT